MHYRGDIQALRRKRNETPQDFELRVRQTVALAYPRADQLIREDLGVQIFIDKLAVDKPDLAKEVYKTRPRTLHDARAQLQFFEDMEVHGHSLLRVRQASTISTNGAERQMEAMQPEIVTLRGQIDHLEIQRRTEPPASTSANPTPRRPSANSMPRGLDAQFDTAWLPGRRVGSHQTQVEQIGAACGDWHWHIARQTAQPVPGTLEKRGKATRPSLENLALLGELSAHSPSKRNRTRVFLVNEGSEPVIIQKGTVIGTFHLIENDLPSCGTLTVAVTTSFELEEQPPCADSTFDTPLARSPEEVRAKLEPLFDFSHISDQSHKEQLLDLLVKYDDVFSRNPEDMGNTTKATHQIETGDAPPVRLPPCRVSPQAKETIGQELDKLTRLGFLEESMSPWGAPVVLVDKKDGTK
ncbi:Hypp2843 [Branchiostoma lanceolatum]|uniref:Hypp2843 protein n=1 Tax=Branchiostoma lanceolatum TaxID=7740 RepID=A0A8J9ZZN3_BRALA|nr:Hypp2843 [Branchiostoma lanceolatum]